MYETSSELNCNLAFTSMFNISPLIYDKKRVKEVKITFVQQIMLERINMHQKDYTHLLFFNLNFTILVCRLNSSYR